MFRDRSWNLIWAIPFWPILLWIITNACMQRVELTDSQIIQRFYNKKPRIMNWEDIDYIYRDGFGGYYIYYVVSNKPIKPRKIIFSGIKDTEGLLTEIVKRVPQAKVDSVIRKKLDKYYNSSNQN